MNLLLDRRAEGLKDKQQLQVSAQVNKDPFLGFWLYMLILLISQHATSPSFMLLGFTIQPRYLDALEH